MSTWKNMERDIANLISLWWFNAEKRIVRSPCSGGWPLKRGEGDVTCADIKDYPYFPFCVDSKHVKYIGKNKMWYLEQLLDCPKHLILKWWYEMNEMKPVKDDGKYRVLVMSKGGAKTGYMMVGEREAKWFTEASPEWKSLRKLCLHVGGSEDPQFQPEVLTFVKFTDFLDTVPSALLRKDWVCKRGLSDG